MSSEKIDFVDREERARHVLAIAADIVDLIDIPVPGRSIMSRALNEAIERRRTSARNILLAEIRSGMRDPETSIIEQIDEFAGITLRYQNAAQEGVRQRNLRLLAKIIVRQIETGQASADSFRPKASVIEQLTDDELDLLGTWLANGPSKSLHEVCDDLGLTKEIAAERQIIAAALIRTALIEPKSGWGSLVYFLTPHALKLLEELKAEDFSES